ncbi:Tll0287-like domain-containing protein [Lacinutrix salivirga]
MKHFFKLVFILLLFFNCNNSKKANPITTEKSKKESVLVSLAITEQGLEYAFATQAVLGKNLMEAINKKGTLGALSFCSQRAYPLTDSMAVRYNATIKRVSDKPRNPKNQANAKELGYINMFKNATKNNEEIKPIVNQLNHKVQVYYPITTNAMCLQCHGKPNTQINTLTLNKLKDLYPNDKATGYSINEVRGLWNITFKD